MTSGVAFLFPGQGSYVPGVFAGIGADADRISARVAEIDAVTAEFQLEPVQPLLFSPDAPALAQLLESDHERLDVAILATSIALAELLESRYEMRPDHVVGHSLGEFGALAVAGVFTPGEAARAVCERHATLRKAPPPEGGMLAVNADTARAEELIASAKAEASAVSARNAPSQTVISGTEADLVKVRQLAREAEIRTSRLHVPGPFHVPQLADASALYARTMRNVRMSAPRERFFYSHGLGRFLTARDDVVDLMVADMTRPVRFHDAVRALNAEGVTTFVECGALDVLTRIVSGSLPRAVTLAPLREAMDTSDLSARLRTAQPSAAAGEPTPTAAADAEVLEGVRAVCAEILEYPLDVVTADADFQADLGVDSLAMTELQERALRRFDLQDRVHDATAGTYATVAGLALYITGLLREGATTGAEQR
ncbi:acyltransferase domain-containing protein [Streptomyces kanamyceticus]|uniref:[acyl-carrier-protein] S-malonyltransferase n=3 Tax=Streptomyces kanamyceticus TaxID=1967 RepID=E9KTA4_STRKN|nr:acyltransferase domain-containing protein [Streptomyces kanamyceticus]ADU56236.1 acyl transferase domain protein [Streptomyces kanamyceticus]QEU89891.1 acyltransferase domain-containing protein [Streptomyces kanamyceticus]